MVSLPTKTLIQYILFFLVLSVSACKADQVLDKCTDRYTICRQLKDAEGDKTIILEQRQSNNKIYDAIENTTTIYTSTKLYFKVLLDEVEQVSIFDELTNCQGNSQAEYIDDSLKVTDLDKNGIREISFLYQLVCENDIHPSKMKLMFVESNHKYKIRGSRHFFTKHDGSVIDEPLAFNIDKSFQNAPKQFIGYAAFRWNKFLFDNKFGELTSKRKAIMKIYQQRIEEVAKSPPSS